MGEKRKLPKYQTLQNRLFRQYKRGAKNRKYSFELTFEQFKKLISKNCHYCNSIPSINDTEQCYHNEDIPFKRNGIDRKNNDIGYTLENSIPCCFKCNKAKMDMNYSEFISLIKSCYNNLIKK